MHLILFLDLEVIESVLLNFVLLGLAIDDLVGEVLILVVAKNQVDVHIFVFFEVHDVLVFLMLLVWSVSLINLSSYFRTILIVVVVNLMLGANDLAGVGRQLTFSIIHKATCVETMLVELHLRYGLSLIKIKLIVYLDDRSLSYLHHLARCHVLPFRNASR